MGLLQRQTSESVKPPLIVRRFRRTVYQAWDPLGKRVIVVKRYDDWRDAVSERDAMRCYGANRYLVRLHRWFVRKGRGYIVMEYVQGRTINDMIAHCGPIPPDKVIVLARNILVGLDVLHRRRYVHGDLHGDNVIVTNPAVGATKIIDLQHAVRLNRFGRAPAKRTLSAPPLKLAPESRRPYIDQRYDIYGVGFICACMLAGRHFRTEAEIDAYIPTDRALWRIVRQAMNPDPRRRFRTARAMFRALQTIRREGSTVPAPAVTGGNG